MVFNAQKNQTSRCQFHQHFRYEIFVLTSFFYVHETRKSCQNAKFVQKIHTFNVDEIDYRFLIFWSTQNSVSTVITQNQCSQRDRLNTPSKVNKLFDFPQHSMILCPEWPAVFKFAYKTSFEQFKSKFFPFSIINRFGPIYLKYRI